MNAPGSPDALSDLRALQRHFALGVTGDDPGPALALLRPSAGHPPRLAAYRHAYRARLTAALRENHPVLHRCLGDEAFDALALGYLARHPSGHPSIRWFGHRLAEHLASLPADEAVPAALVDLARMEWALGSSFDAADAPPLATDALAACPPDDWPALRFTAHPSLQLLQLDWAIEGVWRTLTADPQAATSDPPAQAHWLLVWRQGLETRWRTLPDDEAELLQAAVDGVDVGTWCERAAAQIGTAAAPAQVVGHLQRWLADELLLMRA